MNDNFELPRSRFPTWKSGSTATGGRKAVADHNAMILDRLRGIAPNKEAPNMGEIGCHINAEPWDVNE